MKFCAPTANWDMKSESSWWPLIGGGPTSSGVRVSQETALTYSAVFACTRVISETLASLPLNLLEQVDDRTTRKAMEHPLYPILHDMPNPEMDIITFLDMQQAQMLNWGNSYAEIERDYLGNVRALWPIHASRIPLCNIYRNGTDAASMLEIVAGEPGEIVYDVKNDDGTVTPIPASDMLHVAGVLSKNGITGISIPLTGAEAIGVAMATEQHAGSFFKNGAVSNMAIKSPKAVSKEKAEYLREQWQRTFGGVKNHYKTLLLEDGMEPHAFSLAPEATQLIDQRGMNARIVSAQLYRVPSHKIGDKEASTYDNVEQEELAFAKGTMLVWVLRWEKAIYRQLLTPKEREKYRPRFNMMGLLRGDSQARAAFYQVLFNIGALSPNDIRELEDLNPINGGDQYFVPANNLVPLDKMAEWAQAQIDKLKSPPPAPQQSIAPDEKTVENLLALRSEQKAFLDQILLRDAANESKEAARIEFERQKREEDIKEFGKPLEQIKGELESQRLAGEKLAESVQQIADKPAPTIDTEPIVDAVHQGHKLVVAALKEHENASNQAEIEHIAAEKAALELKKAEIEQARAAARVVLEIAIRREIEQLAAWESKWISKAIEKPREWKDSKSGYYLRFSERFVDRMAEFKPLAAECGVEIDAEDAAATYSRDSLRDLKVTDRAAEDNYHDELGRQVEAVKSSWGERAAALARDMIERGTKETSDATAN